MYSELALILADKNPNFATSVAGTSIDSPFIREYLDTQGYFADLEYISVSNSPLSESLAVGNREDNIRGVDINGKRYAIHLITCNHSEPRCSFRINGVPTGSLEAADKATGVSKSRFSFQPLFLTTGQSHTSQTD